MKRFCLIQRELKAIIAAFVMTDVNDTNSMIFSHIPIAMFARTREIERERERKRPCECGQANEI